MFCPCEECGDFTVPPLMSCNRDKDYCSAEPYCTPCIPQCVKVPVVYCCERPKPKSPPKGEREDCVPLAHHSSRDTRHSNKCDCSRCRYCSPPCCASQPSCCKSHSPQRNCSHHECSPCCDAYCHTPCKPVRTKYVIPCYRYDDGRIFQERYVPTRHGTLPMSAYKRNGIQDHVYGYRGAQKYLCAGQCCDGVCCVHMIVEPIRKFYRKISHETFPAKKKKDRKSGVC
ncbi:keratin-associated protein 10-11-like isoform X2 [Hyposmocoma kahamanoa]|uniref:keratin-associated protein 10-11-like isoform X2 n=1 Tax=Hyposmocoma kahamanoa TaxID=1477025 RepID=UPI000E6D8243|nr:keratin-associated protein 10-11-like isoform X2 [Hyposmocoma kahamanoa]